MKQTNVCIIGAGGIGHSHAKAYLAQKGRANITACCDLYLERAQAFAKEFGIPRVYLDYNEMMEKEKPDCVSVSTWNSSHKGATIAALRGGANVLCEKPMALNAREAEEMAAVARETGKLLQIGFVRRFGRNAEIAKKFIDEGALGDIYYAKVHFLRQDGCPQSWFGDKAYADGGPLIDLGVHIIDLARYLSGCPKPVSAYGVTYDHIGSHRAGGHQAEWEALNIGDIPFKHDVEDMATAMVRFDNGMTLLAETSFNLNIGSAVTQRQVQLFGTKGGILLEPGIEVNQVQGGVYVQTKPLGESRFSFGDSFVSEIAHFLDASEGLVPCRAPMEDGVLLMKILDAVYASARTGKLVEIA